MNFSNNNKCNHIIQKSINLFNFSNLKSEQLFRTSDCNSFNYDFSNHELNKTGFKNISNQKKKTSKNFIKKIDMTIPSNEKLKEEKFRSDFFMNYENSFANFCGINEKIFSEIYEKNDYIPTFNQIGDIKINISNIIQNINKFSHSKKIKVRRLVGIHNKSRKFVDYKTKKIFRISKVKKNKKNIKSGDSNNSVDSKSTNGIDILSNSNQNDYQKEKTFLNKKRNIDHISISEYNNFSNNFLFSPIYFNFDNNNDSKSNSNQDIDKDFLILSDDNSNNQYFGNKDNNYILSNDYHKNYFFHFSSQAIQIPDNKIEQNNNNNISPYKLIISPQNFSFDKINSKLYKNISIDSPYDINNIFNKIFDFSDNYINNTN